MVDRLGLPGTGYEAALRSMDKVRMKQAFAGDRLWITAYTNDVSTYVVSRRLIAEGGYEVNNSLSTKLSYGQAQAVDPAVEDRIVDTLRELLPTAFHRPQ